MSEVFSCTGKPCVLVNIDKSQSFVIKNVNLCQTAVACTKNYNVLKEINIFKVNMPKHSGQGFQKHFWLH